MAIDPNDPTIRPVLDHLLALHKAGDNRTLNVYMARLRENRWPIGTLGTMLGITRQAAQQRCNKGNEDLLALSAQELRDLLGDLPLPTGRRAPRKSAPQTHASLAPDAEALRKAAQQQVRKAVTAVRRRDPVDQAWARLEVVAKLISESAAAVEEAEKRRNSLAWSLSLHETPQAGDLSIESVGCWSHTIFREKHAKALGVLPGALQEMTVEERKQLAKSRRVRKYPNAWEQYAAVAGEFVAAQAQHAAGREWRQRLLGEALTEIGADNRLRGTRRASDLLGIAEVQVWREYHRARDNESATSA
jgi:hypothetical protein